MLALKIPCLGCQESQKTPQTPKPGPSALQVWKLIDTATGLCMMPTCAVRSEESPSSEFALLSEVPEWSMYSMCRADGQEEVKNTLAILASVRWLHCTRSCKRAVPLGCRVGLHAGYRKVAIVSILEPTVTVAWCPQTVAPVKNLISPLLPV